MNYGSDKVGFILCDGFDLKGHLTDINDDGVEAVIDDRTLLGDSFPTPRDTGMAKAALSQEGWYDDTVGGWHLSLFAARGLKRVFCYAISGNAIGSLFTGFAGALQGKFARVLGMGKFTRAKVDYVISGEREDGVVIHAHAQESATGGTQLTPVDNGVLSSLGGAGYLQVSEMTGPTNLSVKLRHSVDNAIYVDLVTFPNVTTTRGASRMPIVGTINRYVAASHTPTGAGTFTYMAGLSRN